MILVAGLTPAWQQILEFDSLTIGQVNRASNVQWCASGKVVNVAIAVARLGGDCQVVVPLGGGPRGPIESELAELGVAADVIEADVPTRVCTTLVDGASGLVTELVQNAAGLSVEHLERFRQVFVRRAASAGTVVLSGSLPAGTPASLYRELLAAALGRVVLDAQGPELLAALDRRPFVVKPNRAELAATLARPLESDDELIRAMRELNQRGAAWVVVTQGEHGVWVSSAQRAYRLQPLRVPRVVNPIGCGDCLAAGVAWSLDEGREPLEAVRIGMACAAQNAAELLPARLDLSAALADASHVEITEL